MMRSRMVSVACLFLSALIAACAPQPPAPPTPTWTPVATPTAVPTVAPTSTPRPTATSVATATALPPAPTRLPTTAAQSAIWSLWQTSAHGNTYDMGKGPNTYCSRCHSPHNWDPASKVDAPPNCVSCKFATDPTVRIAKSNPFVAQTDWRNIGCDICHPLQGGLAGKEIAWFNKASGKYEPVANSTTLCEKCHADTDVLHHRIDLGKSAHTNMLCTQCHNAHSLKASCVDSHCHTTLSKVSGHDAVHAQVSCAACHDASKLRVGPNNTTKIWTTWQTTEVAGNKITSPVISHNLGKSVDCTRCHFEGNPWDLSAAVSKTP